MSSERESRLSTGFRVALPAIRIEHLVGAALLLALTAPFTLATSGGFSAGLGGLPAASSWDAIMRVLAASTHLYIPRPIDGLPESPLWTLLLFVLNGAFGWSGLPLTVVARVAGLIFVAIGLVNLARVGSRLGLSRLIVALMIGIVLIDPWTAFSRAAGSSAGLLFAIVTGAILALHDRRDRHLRWLLVVLACARVDGGVGLLTFGAIVLADRLWILGHPKPSATGAVFQTISLVGPGLLLVSAMAIWESFGERFPIGRGVIPDAGDIEVALTWFRALGWIFGVFAAGALVWTSIRTTSRIGPRALIVPLAGCLGIVWLAQRVHSFGSAPDGLLESEGVLIVPFLAVAGAILTRDVSRAGALFVQRRTLRTRFGLAATAVIAIITLAPWLAGSYRLWLILPETYAGAARDVAEGAQAAGTWLARRVPAGAVFAILPGGEPAAAVLRAEPLRIPPRASNAMIEDVIASAAIDYVLAAPSSAIAQSPRLRVIARTAGNRPDGSGFEGVSVFAFQSTSTEVPADEPVAVRIGEYSLLDRLDVGDPASEVAHFYASTSTRPPEVVTLATSAGWIRDDGRIHEFGRGAETFFLRLPIKRDVVLVVRYLSEAPIVGRLDIEHESFDVPFDRCLMQTCELTLFIPGATIENESSRARMVVPALRSGRGTLTILHYWAFGRQ